MNMFHNYETEKITRKASNMAEYIELFASSIREIVTLFSERSLIYASCMTISGGRTKQHVIIGFGELAAVD